MGISSSYRFWVWMKCIEFEVMQCTGFQWAYKVQGLSKEFKVIILLGRDIL